MGYEPYHDEDIDRVMAQVAKERQIEALARHICAQMSGNYSLFDNLSQPMLIQLDQSDFYTAAQAAIEFLDAEVAKR